MPLTNTNIVKTGIFFPANAANVQFAWEVEGGVVVSGGNTIEAVIKFNPVPDVPDVRKSITFIASNECSTQSKTKQFDVCNGITGLTINGSAYVPEGSLQTYTISTTEGYPLNAEFGLQQSTDGSTGEIFSSTSNSVTFRIYNGAMELQVSVYDCDGTEYSAFLLIDTHDSECIPVTSCDFN